MYNSGAKGNNGVAAKKNFVKRLAFIVALAAGLVLCIYLLQSKDDGVKLDWKNRRREDETHRIGRIKDNLDYNHMKGAMNRQRDAFKHGREHDKIGDKDKFRIRGEVFAGDKHKGRKHQQIEEGDDTIELIVRGELHLVDIQVSSKSLDREGYSDVFGLFCEIDWSIHKSDPSATAMFRDLASKSGCAYGSSTKRVNLDSVMKAVREHDNSNEGQHQITAMEPTGFVFHESRCGSTLVANSLAAFSPETNRVYSESPPPINVLKACAKSRACNVEKQIELFRDVLYLMGRTNDADEKYLFFKFQSVTTLHVNLVQKAFPKIPWIFVYRDPVEVMMSHIGAGDSRSAVCLRTQHNPPQETLDLVDRFGLSMYSLSNEEYCAAYLVGTLFFNFENHLELLKINLFL